MNMFFKRLIVPLLLCLVVKAEASPIPAAQIRSELVRWEGYRTEPYPDAGGYSVGIGHFLGRDAQNIKPTYSAQEIEAFFCSDAQTAVRICRQGISNFDNLPPEKQLVCISLAFNVGPTGFMKFQKFRAAMSKKDWQTAAKELQSSKWASQVGTARKIHHVKTIAQN